MWGEPGDFPFPRIVYQEGDDKSFGYRGDHGFGGCHELQIAAEDGGEL